MTFQVGDRVRRINDGDGRWSPSWGAVGDTGTVVSVDTLCIRVLIDGRGGAQFWWDASDAVLESSAFDGDRHTDADLAMALELAALVTMHMSDDEGGRFDVPDDYTAVWLRTEVTRELLTRAGVQEGGKYGR